MVYHTNMFSIIVFQWGMADHNNMAINCDSTMYGLSQHHVHLICENVFAE